MMLVIIEVTETSSYFKLLAECWECLSQKLTHPQNRRVMVTELAQNLPEPVKHNTVVLGVTVGFELDNKDHRRLNPQGQV